MGRMARELNAATERAYDRRDLLQAVADLSNTPAARKAVSDAEEAAYQLDRQAQLAERAGR